MNFKPYDRTERYASILETMILRYGYTVKARLEAVKELLRHETSKKRK